MYILLLTCVGIVTQEFSSFQHVWYQPASYRDAKGNKIRFGRVAKGCLFDRNHNYRGFTKSASASTALDIQPPTTADSVVDLITAEAGSVFSWT